MKNTELGTIIEKLGRDMARYECQSILAYRDQDFEASRRYHEKALAMEKRVAKYLDEEPLSKQNQTRQPGFTVPRCLSS